MKRDERYAEARWDEPFWHAVRMVLDISRGRVLAIPEGEIVDRLRKAGTEAANGLIGYLDKRPDYLPRIAEYLEHRVEAEAYLAAKLRSEEEAITDLTELGEEEIRRYKAQSADHHQSSQAAVGAVAVITRMVCEEEGVAADVSPQSRAVIIAEDHIWVSPRRLDGALPALLNPVGIWEIKEYWGVKGGGSKMSDAIYECQLVGQELRAFKDLHGPSCRHFVILDGKESWAARRADLRRAVDLLSMGLIDELVVGREILEEWPRIVREMCVQVTGG